MDTTTAANRHTFGCAEVYYAYPNFRGHCVVFEGRSPAHFQIIARPAAVEFTGRVNYCGGPAAELSIDHTVSPEVGSRHIGRCG